MCLQFLPLTQLRRRLRAYLELLVKEPMTTNVTCCAASTSRSASTCGGLFG